MYSGSSFIGQTVRHLPQWMHVGFSTERSSLSVKNRMPAVPLMLGASRFVAIRPIMGPPRTIFFGSTTKPPHCSTM